MDAQEISMKLKCMTFLKDDKLLEKHNKILSQVYKSIKKEFDSEPVHNKKYIRKKKKNLMKVK